MVAKSIANIYTNIHKPTDYCINVMHTWRTDHIITKRINRLNQQTPYQLVGLCDANLTSHFPFYIANPYLRLYQCLPSLICRPSQSKLHDTQYQLFSILDLEC